MTKEQAKDSRSPATTRRLSFARWSAFVFGLIAIHSITLGAANRPIRAVQGQERNVNTKMVSESWYATLSPPSSGPQKRVKFIGQFPGFLAAKQKVDQVLLNHLAKSRSAKLKNAKGLNPDTTSSGSSVVFNGPNESDTIYIPPDSQVATGPTQVVVTINTLIAIYDKTGAIQGSMQDLSSFFNSLGVMGQISDPRIIYDQTDGRFILTADDVDFTTFSSGVVLLAVSQTSDATGIWNKYAINFEGRDLSNTYNTFPDFPTLGLSPSAVYISTGQFVINSGCLDADACPFSDTWIKVIGLPELLSGSSTLTVTTFKNVQTAAGQAAFAIEPALSYGTPPAEFLAAADFSANPNTTLDLFSINLTGTPTLQTTSLTVPGYSLPPDAVQPDSGALIMTDDFRLLNAVWSGGSLWTGQNVADTLGFNPVAQWYQIQLSDLSSASLVQSGSVAGAGAAYYPALSVTTSGLVGMFFSTSSDSLFASAAFTGRESSDPLGAMRSFGIFEAGTGPYNEEPLPNRWGDYSGISLDPDGQTLWGIAELAGTPNPNFQTAVAGITGPPEIAASPDSLDFGSVLVGVSSSPLGVTLTNTSSGSIPISQLTIGGTNGADFQISGDGCSGVALASNQTCTFSVIFNPSSAAYVNQEGYENAFVSVPYSGSGNMITVGLSGNGAEEAILTFSPTSLAFPDTALAGSSAPQTVTLNNTGNVAFEISQISASSAFTETNNCTSSLAAGASCQLEVTFRPNLAMSYQTSLQISSETQGWVYLPLSGTGITAPAAVFCPTSITFPSQTVNTTSSPQTVIMTNTGSEPLTITNFTITGNFAQTSNCGSALAAGASCQIDVTFTPSSSGSLTGGIQIYDDASGSPQALTLLGTGGSSTASLIKTVRTGGSGTPLSLTGSPARSPSAQSEKRKAATDELAEMPIFFEPNEGQFASGVVFGARFGEYNLAITRSEMVFQTSFSSPRAFARNQHAVSSAGQNSHPPELVRLTLEGANPGARPSGVDKSSGRINYIIGRNPDRWRANVPTYAKVMVHEIYPGIDLEYYGNRSRLEYDFDVAPGANPENIRFKFDDPVNPENAPKVSIDSHGDLLVELRGQKFQLRRPIVYQTSASNQPGRRTKHFFAAQYRLLASNEVGFELPNYDAKKHLVIDPIIIFSTYLGGSGGDSANAIAVDSSGNAYITGESYSLDFPVTSGAFQTTCASAQSPCSNLGDYPLANAFVAELSADGSKLIYATYLGGTTGTGASANAIAVDSSGNAYIAGTTSSTDFPTTVGAFQTQCKTILQSGECDTPFVTKLNPGGSSLVYSTYLGGTATTTPPSSGFSPTDAASGVAVDSTGDAFVTGSTSAPDFPVTSGAFQTAGPQPGNTIGFVTKINSAGSSLIFSTYLGGTANDQLDAVSLDASGNAYVAGTASSLDFPTTAGALQTGSYFAGLLEGGPSGEGVIAKFSPSGTLLWSTYLGRSPYGDSINAIAVDASGAVYATGEDGSSAFPVTVPQQGSLAAFPAFLAKLHPAGCALLYGANFEPFPANSYPYEIDTTAISLDASDDIYVAGYIDAAPLSVNAVQPDMTSGSPFLTEMDPTGSNVLFSTALGGSGVDDIHDMALGPTGDIYVTGQTDSSDFPSASALQSTAAGLPTAFVARINISASSNVLLTRPSLTFAPVPVGYYYQPEAIGLMNDLSSPLSISSVTVAGSGFSSVQAPVGPPPLGPAPCTGSIAPGAGCVTYVQFQASEVGPATGTLTINDDGPGSPRVVTLDGTGLADFALEATSGPDPSPVLAGDASVQFNIAARTAAGVQPVQPGAVVDLSCTNISPATCSLSPTSISLGSTFSTLTVGNLAALGQTPLNFDVVGTLGTQTYSLPLTIAVEDFALGASPNSASVTPGQAAAYTLTLTPVNGFNQALTFDCTGLPSGATCTPSPLSVTLDGSHSAQVTITISTTAPTSALYRLVQPIFPLGRLSALGIFLMMLSWLIIVFLLSVRWCRRSPINRFVLSGVLLLVLFLEACGGGGNGGGGGGGNPSTPSGTYNITVNASSGSLTHSANVTLNVQ